MLGALGGGRGGRNFPFYLKPVILRRMPEKIFLRDLSEISRGGGEVETEGGSQLFETQKRGGGIMKNGPLKEGGSRKYVRLIM